jgi:hypothetical protein
VVGLPGRFERPTAGSDDQQGRDRESRTTVEPSLIAVQLEDGFSSEDQVQLLLPACAFVVLFDERLVGAIRIAGA